MSSGPTTQSAAQIRQKMEIYILCFAIFQERSASKGLRLCLRCGCHGLFGVYGRTYHDDRAVIMLEYETCAAELVKPSGRGAC